MRELEESWSLSDLVEAHKALDFQLELDVKANAPPKDKKP
jgi:hypothetical protein